MDKSSEAELLNDESEEKLNLDSLLEDDEVVEEPKEEELPDDETPEGEAEAEPEIELETGEEDLGDKVNLITPARKADILKKYPALFKDFPYLEVANYRDKEFSEVFPTIEDAREAAEKAQTFEQFQGALFSGNTDQVLSAVKESDPNAFARIVDNYLPTLNKIDPAAHSHVVGNIAKTLVAEMFSAGKQTDNEDLKAAAALVNQFIFGPGAQWTPPTKFSKESNEHPQSQELNKQKAQFAQQQYSSVQNDLSGKVHNAIKATISTNIDPKGSMSSYVKKTAITESLNDVDKIIQSDDRFKSYMSRLWQDAHQKGYSPDSVNKIKSTYLAKVKTLLPDIIKKQRAEALKGMGRNNKSEKDRKGPLPVGRSSSGIKAGSDKQKAKEIPKGTKTLDFLMSD